MRMHWTEKTRTRNAIIYNTGRKLPEEHVKNSALAHVLQMEERSCFICQSDQSNKINKTEYVGIRPEWYNFDQGKKYAKKSGLFICHKCYMKRWHEQRKKSD